MAARRGRISLKAALAWLLAASLRTFTAAQDIAMSNDASDYPSSYRYIMNGTELNAAGIDSLGLVPLSASLWSLSPEEFSKIAVGGNLQNVNASTATRLPPYTVPYISCDEPDVMQAVTESFNATNPLNVLVAILYSQNDTHCRISNSLTVAGWLRLFTVSDFKWARKVAALELTVDSAGIVEIFPDLSTIPPGTTLHSRRRGSPIPMIILYALTSMITVLLLVVIVGGAIKARRHPERYGPRAVHRPRQSRARGIAMAMLETLPIVRFGDPDSKNTKAVAGGREGDVELAVANKNTRIEPTDPKTDPTSTEVEITSPTLADDRSQLGAHQTVTVEAAASNTKDKISEPNTTLEKEKDKAKAADNRNTTTTTTTSSPPEASDNSLVCSICTDDFSLGEELRVLPCNHKFHAICVDPWLLNVSGTCPLCRVDLRPPQETADTNGNGNNSNHHNQEEDITPAMELLITGHQPRHMMGGIMRGSRSADVQTVSEASREERIRILRRWAEERRRAVQLRRSRLSEGNVARRASDVPERTRSQRLSHWIRDGFSARSPPPTPPPTQQQHDVGGDGGGGGGGGGGGVRSELCDPANRRPRTWYAGVTPGQP